MNIIKTAIEGLVIIEPRLFKDDRGYFFESFSQKEFNEKVTPAMESFGDYISRNHPTHKVNWCVSLKAVYLM